MTTFTWAGGSAPWTSPVYWLVNGSSTGNVPEFGDTAIIGGTLAETIAVSGTQGVSSLLITDEAAVVAVGTSLATGSLVNAGTIAAAANAQLKASGNGTFSNTGVITLGSKTGFDVNIPTTTGALGTIENDGGFVALLGSVDNTEATLSDAVLGELFITGTIHGGTIDDGGKIGFATSIPEFDGVTFVLSQTTSNPAGELLFGSGLEISGGFAVEIAGGNDGTVQTPFIEVLDTETIDHMSLFLSADGGSTAELQADATLTMGPQLSLEAVNPAMLSGRNLISHGTITDGETMTIESSNFTNTGVLSATHFFSISTLAVDSPSFANTGTVSADGGTITVADGAFTNGGTLIASNAGTIVVGESVAGNGVIALSGNGTVELTKTYGQQSFDFTGAGNLLRLDFASGTHTLQGFDHNQTIELVSTPATVAFSAGTLTASTTGGTPFAGFVLPGVAPGTMFNASVDESGNTFITEVACFAKGTRIATPAGDVPVETLAIGQHVISAFGGSAPVTWLGHRHLDCRRHNRPQQVWPVRVRAGAFRTQYPSRDLLLSPDHAVFINGVLIPVRYLVNGSTIAQEQVDEIVYYHVELPAHDVVLAEGLACESYLDTGNRAAFANGGDAVMLHADFAHHVWQASACAELVLYGTRLDDAKRMLLARAEALGHGVSHRDGGAVISPRRKMG